MRYELDLDQARVRVRRFTEQDLAGFLAYQALPEVRQHQPGTAMTDEQAAGFIATQGRQPSSARGAWHGRAVELIAEQRLIGDVGVWVPAGPDRPVVGDLGFQLDPEYHGHGYARAALEAFIPVAVREFGLDRVTATCREANRASWGLLERVGMRLERSADGERTYSLTPR